MAQQNIRIGSAPNDKTGDPLRTAFTKVNANFTELYTLTGGSSAALTELVQDYAAPLFNHASHTNITVTYDDANNKILLTGAAAQVQSNWTASSGLGVILNKPTLFSGSYTDLTNKPTIPTSFSSLVNGASNVSISTADGVPTITRAPYISGPQSYPAATWTFGSGPIGSALAIPGYIQGPSQTGFVSADNWGLAIDSANTPASISLGRQDGNNNVTKFFWGSGSKNGIAGDVEIQTIPVSGTPTSIILSPQGGQNGSFIFGGTGNLTFPDTTVQTTAWTPSSSTTSTLVNGSYTVELGSTGTLTLPATNKVTAANTPQAGYRIVVTDNTIGASPTGNGDGSTWMEFDASKTSFVNQIWNPYCVGAPDSIIGWTVTAADNTVSKILHANNSGPAYWIIVDQSFGPGPYTFLSPDYMPASANDVHIEVGGHNWTFAADGNLTLPTSGVLNADTINVGTLNADNLNLTFTLDFLKLNYYNYYSGTLSGSTFVSITGTSAGSVRTIPGLTQSSTSGRGTGALFQTTVYVSGGIQSYLNVVLDYNGGNIQYGTGYAVGDTVTINGNLLGGTTPANDLTFTIGSRVSKNYPIVGQGTMIYDYSIKHFLMFNGSTWTQIDSPLTPTGTKASNAYGVAGQTSFDSNYFYVCIANNTWRRVALGSTY